MKIQNNFIFRILKNIPIVISCFIIYLIIEIITGIFLHDEIRTHLTMQIGGHLYFSIITWILFYVFLFLFFKYSSKSKRINQMLWIYVIFFTPSFVAIGEALESGYYPYLFYTPYGLGLFTKITISFQHWLGNWEQMSLSNLLIYSNTIARLELLSMFMPETRFAPAKPADRNTWQHMGDIFKKGIAAVRSRPVLMAVLGVGFIYGLYSEGWDRLWIKYLVDNFTLPRLFGMNEVAFFGILRATGMLLSILVTRQVEKRLDSNHAPSIAKGMLWLTGLLALAIFVYAFSPLLTLSIGALLMVSVTRSVIGPLYNAWVNQRLDPDTRATVISMSGQVDAIGQIASGPLAGFVSLWSIQAAIACASFLLVPALPLIRRANRLHNLSQADQIEK